MLDKLYCPDFSTVCGEKYRNPYDFPKIDGLVWPTILDVKPTEKSKKLLELSKDGTHPLFYRRKISLKQLITELKCADLEGACIQAIDMGSYGVESQTVIDFCKSSPVLYPIISPQLTNEGISQLKQQIKEAVAVVIYPSYQHIELSKSNELLQAMLEICATESKPIKIDLGNMYLPENQQRFCTPEIIREFLNTNPKNQFILSGIDLGGNGSLFVNLLRYERNAKIELDPRTFGGWTPQLFFETLLKIPGFIQFGWDKFLLGSSTPMLEASQVSRGFWNATAKLSFAQQSIMRTWMFRNIVRAYNIPVKNQGIHQLDDAPAAVWLEGTVAKQSENEIFIHQDLELNSFSITQLLDINPYITVNTKAWLNKYSDYKFGELTLKSYHTTTALFVNEHEYGNFLQLHYNFAEDTMAEAADKMHTTAALENRADFNYPDHITASTRGQRVISAPIVNGQVKFGGRENLYVLVTFGPRSLKLSLTLKIFRAL